MSLASGLRILQSIFIYLGLRTQQKKGEKEGKTHEKKSRKKARWVTSGSSRSREVASGSSLVKMAWAWESGMTSSSSWSVATPISAHGPSLSAALRTRSTPDNGFNWELERIVYTRDYLGLKKKEKKKVFGALICYVHLVYCV